MHEKHVLAHFFPIRNCNCIVLPVDQDTIGDVMLLLSSQYLLSDVWVWDIFSTQSITATPQCISMGFGLFSSFSEHETDQFFIHNDEFGEA